VAYIGLENIEAHTGKLVGETTVDASTIKSLKSRFQSGDILYGKLRPNLNKVYVANSDGICSTDIFVLRPKSDVDGRLLAAVLRSTQLNEQVLKGLGGAQLPRVSYEYMKALTIPLPALDIQREIVAEIEGYQKIIDGARQVVENYRPSIPVSSDWPVVPLEEIADFKNGLNYDADGAGAPVRIVGVSHFKNHLVASPTEFDLIRLNKPVESGYLLAPDDILFVRSNGNQELVGRSMLIPELPEPSTFSGFTIRCRFKAEVEPRFYAYLFKSPRFRTLLKEGGQGSSIRNLSQSLLRELPVPFPGLEQQREIVIALDEERALINANKTLIARFEAKSNPSSTASGPPPDGASPADARLPAPGLPQPGRGGVHRVSVGNLRDQLPARQLPVRPAGVPHAVHEQRVRNGVADQAGAAGSLCPRAAVSARSTDAARCHITVHVQQDQ
jgi:restriction endonuclease S subunit